MSKMKVCAVSHCKNTSATTPDKVFVFFPTGKKQTEQLKKWHLAVFGNLLYWGCTLYACEDHFNMQQDMENWMMYRYSSVRLRIKSTCVPHLRLNAEDDTQLSDSEKKRQHNFVDNYNEPKKLKFKNTTDPVILIDSDNDESVNDEIDEQRSSNYETVYIKSENFYFKNMENDLEEMNSDEIVLKHELVFRDKDIKNTTFTGRAISDNNLQILKEEPSIDCFEIVNIKTESSHYDNEEIDSSEVDISETVIQNIVI